MSNKETFIIYTEMNEAIQKMPNDIAGELFKAIMLYNSSGEVPKLSEMAEMAFSFFKPQFDRNNKRWEETKSTRSKRAKNAANERWEKNKDDANECLEHKNDANECLEHKNDANECLEHKNDACDADNDNDNDNDNVNNIPPYSPQCNKKQEKKIGIDKMFDMFWDVYPKKRSKISAYKKFCKINPSQDLFESMIRAVKTQAKTDQWAKDGGEYIPYPSTWLSSGAWMDEVCIDKNNDKEIPPEEEPAHTNFREYGYETWNIYRDAYLSGYESFKLWE